jgi:LacI family gluconate utilization system Gnt-I transcriptional repressor
MVALGVLTEAQAQGIRVPEQLAIVGLGDLAMSRELHPALTSVRVDGTLVGGVVGVLLYAISLLLGGH